MRRTPGGRAFSVFWPGKTGGRCRFFKLLKTGTVTVTVTVTALAAQDSFMRLGNYGAMVDNGGKAPGSMIWRPFSKLVQSRCPVTLDGSLHISCSRHSCRHHSPICGRRRDVPGDRSGCRDRSGAPAVCSSRCNSRTGIRHNSKARQTRCTGRHSSDGGSVCHAGAGDGRRGGAPGLPGMSHE